MSASDPRSLEHCAAQATALAPATCCCRGRQATCRAPVVLQILPRGPVAEVGDKHPSAVVHPRRAPTAAAAAAVRALVTIVVSECHCRERDRTVDDTLALLFVSPSRPPSNADHSVARSTAMADDEEKPKFDDKQINLKIRAQARGN